jgi:hypothetical protein
MKLLDDYLAQLAQEHTATTATALRLEGAIGAMRRFAAMQAADPGPIEVTDAMVERALKWWHDQKPTRPGLTGDIVRGLLAAALSPPPPPSLGVGRATRPLE